MMKYLSYLIFSLIFFAISEASAQNMVLFSENFNSGSHSFELNSNEVGGDFGDNTWIVNDEYDGKGIYPNTTTQDSVSGTGSINGAPDSEYLHIHDSEASSQQNVANANYNPASASDRFVAMKNGICTKSLENVKLSFYYLVKGRNDAYAQLYFKKEGAGWKLASNDKFRQSLQWERYDLSNQAFDNASGLQFGFRWVNDSTSGSGNTGFSIDDIHLIAEYNQNTTVTASVLEDSVCKGAKMTVNMSLSDTLCSGTYRFMLSDNSGSFQNSMTLGSLSWNEDFPTDSNLTVPLPQNIQTGNCYKVRIDRIQPAPMITGVASDCFMIVECPVVITTLQPTITYGAENSTGYAVCAGSAVDIPFSSIGIIESGNKYVAQISNQLDTLSNNEVVLVNPVNISEMQDDNDYPNSNSPGIISGNIPESLSEGCEYYLQVNSTSPAAEGIVWGPFCIRKCDITTNDGKDIQACVSDTSGFQQKVAMETNSWDTSANYLPGNEFKLQVLDRTNLNILNTGGLGVLANTQGDSITLQIPQGDSLTNLGLTPGEYYLRIVATNSTAKDDTMGSIIRFSFGSYSSSVEVVAGDSIICKGDLMNFHPKPYSALSDYEWELSVGPPSIIDEFNFSLSTTILPAGDYATRVRELSFGCKGPWSNWDTVLLIKTPDAAITAPDEICKHEEISISAPYTEHTFYDWDLDSSGTILSNNKNDLIVKFDSAGMHKVTMSALNQCGSDLGFKIITVIDTVASISGTLRTSSNSLMDDTKVLLVRYNSLDSSLSAIDTTITNNGSFGLQTTGANLYVKAIPDSTEYPNQMPTYFNSALTWENAVAIDDSFCGDAQITFSTIAGNNPGGPGFISGRVTEGAGKKQGAGDPMSGMTLFLVNPQGEPVTYGIADENGWFEMSDFPLGNYELVGDWPYLKNEEAPTIELTVSEPRKDSLHVRMIDRKLEIGTLTGWIGNFYKALNIKVYPNPADEILIISRNFFFNGKVHFELYDIWGRIIQRGLMHGAVKYLDVSSLDSGIYFVRVSGGNENYLRKIMIVH